MAITVHSASRLLSLAVGSTTGTSVISTSGSCYILCLYQSADKDVAGLSWSNGATWTRLGTNNPVGMFYTVATSSFTNVTASIYSTVTVALDPVKWTLVAWNGVSGTQYSSLGTTAANPMTKSYTVRSTGSVLYIGTNGDYLAAIDGGAGPPVGTPINGEAAVFASALSTDGSSFYAASYRYTGSLSTTVTVGLSGTSAAGMKPTGSIYTFEFTDIALRRAGSLMLLGVGS